MVSKCPVEECTRDRLQPSAHLGEYLILVTGVEIASLIDEVIARVFPDSVKVLPQFVQHVAHKYVIARAYGRGIGGRRKLIWTGDR